MAATEAKLIIRDNVPVMPISKEPSRPITAAFPDLQTFTSAARLCRLRRAVLPSLGEE